MLAICASLCPECVWASETKWRWHWHGWRCTLLGQFVKRFVQLCAGLGNGVGKWVGHRLRLGMGRVSVALEPGHRIVERRLMGLHHWNSRRRSAVCWEAVRYFSGIGEMGWNWPLNGWSSDRCDELGSFATKKYLKLNESRRKKRKTRNLIETRALSD